MKIIFAICNIQNIFITYLNLQILFYEYSIFSLLPIDVFTIAYNFPNTVTFPKCLPFITFSTHYNSCLFLKVLH